MSKNLKSLMSGALKCGTSQFKANIPSIQGVTLSPATDNPVNFVFETSKAGADEFMAAISAASVPHYTEEYTLDDAPMVRIFAAIPEVANFCSEAEISFGTRANVYCYKSGVLPASWFSQILQGGASGSKVFFVNSVELTEEAPLLDAYAAVSVFFMKDATLAAGALMLMRSSTLIFNGRTAMPGEAVTMSYYEPSDPDSGNTTVVITPQQDNTQIKEGAIGGDIMNLYYGGEWDATTRAWFSGRVFHLNGENLDPVPSE